MLWNSSSALMIYIARPLMPPVPLQMINHCCTVSICISMPIHFVIPVLINEFLLRPVLPGNRRKALNLIFPMNISMKIGLLTPGHPAIGKHLGQLPINRQFDQPGLFDNFQNHLVDFNWSHKFNDQWQLRNGVTAMFLDENWGRNLYMGLE